MKPAEDHARPLRILEVGGHQLFALAVPQQTEFCWTATKPRHLAGFALGPVQLIRNLARLRRREFDLLVVHATQYAPWHPRTILTTLRSWHVRSPLGLFAVFAWRFVHLFHDVPIAAVDLGDSCLLPRHNFFLLKSCRYFFKRELPTDHWVVFCRSGYPDFPGRRWRKKRRYVEFVEKLRPISYGSPLLDFGVASPPQDVSAIEKKADIFFAGAIEANSTVRTAGISELRELQRQGFAIDVPTERIAGPDFIRRMSAAWLAWSPAGLGWDCGRHYEAALAGAVPLMSHPTIMRDMPLRDGEHCVLYAVETGGLAQAARRALADKPRLLAMAQAAAAHVATHHTLFARAERIAMSVLGRKLDGTRVGRDAHDGEPREGG